MITLYGIPNCDTVKRARKALEAAGIDHTFHDFRRDGLPADEARRWLRTLGADQLINRRGTTWRKLDDAQRDCHSEADWLALMQAEPSLIKRPVIARGEALKLGFAASEQDAILSWLRA